MPPRQRISSYQIMPDGSHRPLKEGIYTAVVTLPTGARLPFAVLSHECDALQDIKVAVHAETHFGSTVIEVGPIQRSNRRILAKMTPIKKCVSYPSEGVTKQWAWIGNRLPEKP